MIRSLPKSLSPHWPALVVGLTSLALQSFDLVVDFRYQRALLSSEPWRLLSGNLVHLGWNHLWLNLAGLALIQALFGSGFSARAWWSLMLTVSLAVGLGLHLWHPQLDWYVGLSGSLHGLFAAGLLLDARRAPLSGLLLGAAFVGKLVWEQMAGALPGSEAAAGGPVLVDAHLYGAVAGAVFGLVLLGWGIYRQRAAIAGGAD